MNKQRLAQALKTFLKKEQFLSLTKDIPFKAYFTKNEILLKSVLTKFLPLPEGSKIVSVHVRTPELLSEQIGKNKKKNAMALQKVGKTFILDLLVEFERISADGTKALERCNVEAQTTQQSYLADRVLAYSARVYSEQLKKGAKYEKLMPVYSLIFTTENLDQLKKD